MIKGVSRATTLHQRFFRLTAKTALTPLPALNGVKESAPRTWVYLRMTAMQQGARS
jgi:hypothetical protein